MESYFISYSTHMLFLILMGSLVLLNLCCIQPHYPHRTNINIFYSGEEDIYSMFNNLFNYYPPSG